MNGRRWKEAAASISLRVRGLLFAAFAAGNQGDKMMHFGERITAVAVLALAIMIMAPAPRVSAEPYLTSDMLSDCEAIAKQAKSKAKSDEVELDNTFQTGTCWGAFLSIQQLITLKEAGAGSPIFHVCAPEELTLVQIIHVFDAYNRRHPKQASEAYTIVALNALRDAFPCR